MKDYNSYYFSVLDFCPDVTKTHNFLISLEIHYLMSLYNKNRTKAYDLPKDVISMTN